MHAIPAVAAVKKKKRRHATGSHKMQNAAALCPSLPLPESVYEGGRVRAYVYVYVYVCASPT